MTPNLLATPGEQTDIRASREKSAWSLVSHVSHVLTAIIAPLENWSSTPSVCLGAISEKDAVALAAELGIAARGARPGIGLEAERKFTTGKTSSGNGWGKFSAERSRIGRRDIVEKRPPASRCQTPTALSTKLDALP